MSWQVVLHARDQLRVTVLSVGAGSATVLQLPDGTVDLYDAGSSGSYDVGRTTIAPFLRSIGVNKVAHVYVSHADMDHFSGLAGLREEIAISNCVINPSFERASRRRSAAQSMIEYLEQFDTPVRVMDLAHRTWNEGGAQFELLWPTADWKNDLSDNDSSTVLRVTFKGHSVLFTGDIEDFAQRTLLHGQVRNEKSEIGKGIVVSQSSQFSVHSSPFDLHADVLVLPHHGSVRNSTMEFVDAVGASTLIRSSGQAMSATTNGLRSIVGRKRVLDTADSGAIGVILDDKGVRVDGQLP